MPTYISFETPFPGTPHFYDILRGDGAKLLPDALLQDFNGYTLVTEPRHASVSEFVDAYKRLHRRVYSVGRACRKILHDVPPLALRGFVFSPLASLYESLFDLPPLTADRTFVTGSEKPYPESQQVPLCDADFDSESQRAAVMEPWRVSDSQGDVLPMWAKAHQPPASGMGMPRKHSDRRAASLAIAP